MKKCLIAAFLVFVPFPVWSSPPDVRPEQIVTLILSSNVYGEIDPCG